MGKSGRQAMRPCVLLRCFLRVSEANISGHYYWGEMFLLNLVCITDLAFQSTLKRKWEGSSCSELWKYYQSGKQSRKKVIQFLTRPAHRPKGSLLALPHPIFYYHCPCGYCTVHPMESHHHWLFTDSDTSQPSLQVYAQHLLLFLPGWSIATGESSSQ